MHKISLIFFILSKFSVSQTYQIGIEVDYGFYKNLSSTLSSQYAMINLIGRKSSEKPLNIINTTINFMYEFENNL